MSDLFRDLISQQGASARQIEDRFARVDNTIEVDLTDAELALLEDRIASGGNFGRAAQDLLDEAIAAAVEAELSARADGSKPSSEGASGDAGTRSSGTLAKPVGKQADEAIRAEALRKAEQRHDN